MEYQIYLDAFPSWHLWPCLLPSPLFQKTVSFIANLINPEEKSKSSSDNISNFTNTLAYNIDAGNYTLDLK